MSQAKQTPKGFWCKGRRGNYVLMFKNQEIESFTNQERLRGVQYFLDKRPEYAAAPELLEAAEKMDCGCTVKERFSGHLTDCNMPALQAAIAKAKGAA